MSPAAVGAGFKVVGSTAICEHGFQNLEHETSRAHATKKCAVRRQYVSTIEAGISHTEHRFGDTAWENKPVPRGDTLKNTDSFFYPMLRLAPDWIRDIVGTNSRPEWYSPAPLYQHNQDVDMQLYEHYDANGGWRSVDDLWLGCLLRGPRLLVGNEKVFGKKAIFFSMPEFFGNVVLGWPAEKVVLAGEVFYQPFGQQVRPSHLAWFIVDGFEGWESQPFKWVSPAHCCQVANCSFVGGILAKPTRAMAPMLQTAAREAFWDMSMPQLTTLCKHMSVECLGQDMLFDRLKRLIEAVLGPGPIRAEELFEIFGKRVEQAAPLEEFAESDLVSGMLVEGEEKDKKQQHDRLQRRKAAEEEYMSKFRAARRSALPRSSRGAGAQGAGTAADRKALKAGPAFTEQSSEGDVQFFMPPGSRIWKDVFNSRWQWIRMKNRSWHCYGFVGSAIMLVDDAWEDYQRRTGETCPWKLVVSDARGGSAPASSRA